MLPDTLPAELHDTAQGVLRILTGIYAERGGDEPTPRGVGLAVQRFPDRDHARVARELEHWALAGTGQRKPVKDWAKTLATFLERSVSGKALTVVDGGGRNEQEERRDRRMAAFQRMTDQGGAA